MITRHRTPVYSDPALLEPDKLHSPSCPITKGKRCRCSKKTTTIPRQTWCQVIEQNESSCRVQIKGHAPTWVATSDLLDISSSTEDADAPAPGERPKDWQLIQPVWARRIPLKTERRRRPLRQGEVVLVREDCRGDEYPKPWRLFCFFGQPGQLEALLIDPGLNRVQALDPTWEHTRHIPVGKPGAASELYPVFPLPDGTADPGW